MQPPCQITPVATIFILVREPWNDDAGSRTHFAILVQLIPNVTGAIGLVACTVVPRFVAFAVYLWGTIRGSNVDWSEGVDQRIKQFRT